MISDIASERFQETGWNYKIADTIMYYDPEFVIRVNPGQRVGTYFASASGDLVILEDGKDEVELSRRTIFTNQPLNRYFDSNWWSIILKPEEITSELLFKDNITFRFELTYVTRSKDLDYTDLF